MTAKKVKSSTSVEQYTIILAVVWTLCIGGSLIWSYVNALDSVHFAASIAARVQIAKDIIYRRWNAGHGGVYIPISASVQPNPYLTEVVEREIATPSGRQLTLINPAYMTRLVHELGLKTEGVRGHITSLNPIRPANAADAWEKRALQHFEVGAQEFTSIESLDGAAHLRLMRPLMTEKGCLKCHAKQGYKEGDVRGGISVSIPMAPFTAIAHNNLTAIGLGHGGLWMLGIFALVFGALTIRERIREHKQVEIGLRESEERQHTLIDAISNAGISLFVVDDKYQVRYMNAPMIKNFGDGVGKICYKSVGGTESPCAYCQLTDVIDRQKKVHYQPTVADGRTFDIIAVPFTDIDGKICKMEVIQDITRRKEADEKLEKSLKETETVNRLMSGREMRIVEMKKEVNNLLTELGREGKYGSTE